LTPVDWLWIPVTVWAALAQTLRNAAQRHLTAELGTLGATLVRFLYGLPFAGIWFVGVKGWEAVPAPQLNASFVSWVLLGAVSQIAATALLLRTMQARNFALGVAYSKTEVLQVALFGLVFLGDPISFAAALAVGAGTLGVLLLSPADKERPLRTLLAGWTSSTALLGLACGALFAMSAVGYRPCPARRSSWRPRSRCSPRSSCRHCSLAGGCSCAMRRSCSVCCKRGAYRCSPASWAPLRRPAGSPRLR
jgi:drug/metabolite transporter (DMT)-like permease